LKSLAEKAKESEVSNCIQNLTFKPSQLLNKYSYEKILNDFVTLLNFIENIKDKSNFLTNIRLRII